MQRDNEQFSANVEVSPKYKWTALEITTIGVLMTAIDGTVVILALPSIMSDLHSNLVRMVWVLMAYILASTVLLARQTSMAA